MAGRGNGLLASETVAWRAGTAHSKVVYSCCLRALLLAPESPGEDGEDADKDRAADAADYAADDGFGLRCQGAAATAAAAFGESRVDGGGCGCDGGDDAVAGYDGGLHGAILGEVGSYGVGLGGGLHVFGGDGRFGGEGGRVDCAAADYDDIVTLTV